jgi:hypothetical protein
LRDEALYAVIMQIPRQVQRQYSTDEQMRVLIAAANRLGLYDAADRIKNQLEEPTAADLARKIVGDNEPQG